MYILLVFFMIFSPSLEARIVITIPPNVHVSTIKNPFPFYFQDDNNSSNDKEIKQFPNKELVKKILTKTQQAPMLNEPQVKNIEHNLNNDRMKKIVTVCTDAFANTKENTVARVVECVLQGFEKS